MTISIKILMKDGTWGTLSRFVTEQWELARLEKEGETEKFETKRAKLIEKAERVKSQWLHTMFPNSVIKVVS